MRKRHAIRSILFMFVAGPIVAGAQSSGATKSILVTGASSGIGRKITERLASHGFFVYAGARAEGSR